MVEDCVYSFLFSYLYISELFCCGSMILVGVNKDFYTGSLLNLISWKKPKKIEEERER